MTTKDIVLVNYSLSAGGAERFISGLANYLVNRNYRISVLLLRKDEIFYDLDKRIRIIQPDFYSGKTRIEKYLYFIKIIFYIRKNIRKIRPSVIVDTAFPFYFMITLLGMQFPVIVPIRCNPNNTGLIEGSYIPLFLRRLVYRRISAIVAQTRYASTILSNQFKHTTLVTIPNFLHNNAMISTSRENIIVSAGHLKKSKGFDYLIRSFSNIISDGWKLIILGEGPERENLQKLIEKNELDNKVLISGNKKDISEYFAKSKIFAFTSLTEGFPNVLLEAMATPLACISFDCVAGPRDLIRDGTNGFLVELGNENEFSRKLQLLIDNENLRNKFMSESIRTRYIYDMDKIGIQYTDLIESLILR